MAPRNRWIPLAAPSPETLAARAEHDRRALLYGNAPSPAVRQVWVERTTGRQIRLLGRKTNTWVAALLGTENQHVTVTLDDHAAHYDYVRTDCDHDEACCSEHSTHASPHRECILR